MPLTPTPLCRSRTTKTPRSQLNSSVNIQRRLQTLCGRASKRLFVLSPRQHAACRVWHFVVDVSLRAALEREVRLSWRESHVDYDVGVVGGEEGWRGCEEGVVGGF